MSLTLRELRRVLSGKIFWLTVGASVMLAALAGPYFTLERMSFAERLVYWGITIIMSALIMTAISIFAYRTTEMRNLRADLVAVVAGLVGTFPVVATVYLAEAITIGQGQGPFDWSGLLRIALYVAPSVIGVTLIVNLVIASRHSDQSTSASPISAPPQPMSQLQRKLPHHLGRTIVCVQAQDHYIEVTTPIGSATVLMRLSDAVADLAGFDGVQIHRSWWINLAHVTETVRGSNGPEVVLSTGNRVTVGRSYRAAFAKALEQHQRPRQN